MLGYNPIFPNTRPDINGNRNLLEELRVLSPSEYLDYVSKHSRNKERSDLAYFFLLEVASKDYREVVFGESENRGLNKFQRNGSDIFVNLSPERKP